VETQAQLYLTASGGYDGVQGHFTARPMAPQFFD
jgi:EAL domain-containing protein (putative c-di-GMP-specific phosphodiesterase class I)